MGSLGRLACLRRCTEEDDAFVYDVFCTTWESEVAALPNPSLAQHVLRIQHIVQNRRFTSRYPGHDRFVIVVDGEPAGRLYAYETTSMLHVVDLTLLPQFRSEGTKSRLAHELFEYAGERRMSITLRVPRRNLRASAVYASLGFQLGRMDDVDNYFEWTPREDTDTATELLSQVECV